MVPANAKANDCNPEAPNPLLPVFKSATSVQAEPFQVSAIALLGSPPTAIPAVVVPVPVAECLSVFKPPTSVHVDPFHCSTSDFNGCSPLAAIAAVDVPNPIKPPLAVLRSPTSVQAEPFHVSATPV